MCCFVTSFSGRCQIRDEDLVIDLCPALARTKVFHRVDVCDVHSLVVVGLDECVFVVVLVIPIILLNVHAINAHIKAVNPLKECDSLLSVVHGSRRFDYSVRIRSHSKMSSHNVWDVEMARTVGYDSHCYSLVCIWDYIHALCVRAHVINTAEADGGNTWLQTTIFTFILI